MSNKNNLAKVYHFDLYGKREDKYEFLNENSLDTIEWNELAAEEPNYFFVKKNFKGAGEYEKGFKIDELFTLNSSGVKTHCDAELISFSKFDNEYNRDYYYKPFDRRFINYDLTKVIRHRYNKIKDILNKDNFGLISCRNQIFSTSALITNCLSDIRFFSNPGSIGTDYVFPLYLYPETSGQQSTEQTAERKPNLNPAIVQEIADGLGLEFVPEKGTKDAINRVSTVTFAPIDILDYIYAVLHSPTYREKYKEFLKIDFPRVPYPKAPSPSERAGGEVFWQLVKLGGELRQIHLLESPVVEKPITQYPIDDQALKNLVSKISFVSKQSAGFGDVYINENQFFGNVSEVAWNFYIGGYQPAQKWLKDRKGRELSMEDIFHYQKIIVGLTETDRIMKKIDEIEVV
jgi:predicted helicase